MVNNSLIPPVPVLPERPSELFTFLNHLKVDSFKEGVKSNTLPLQTVRLVGSVIDSDEYAFTVIGFTMAQEPAAACPFT